MTRNTFVWSKIRPNFGERSKNPTQSQPPPPPPFQSRTVLFRKKKCSPTAAETKERKETNGAFKAGLICFFLKAGDLSFPRCLMGAIVYENPHEWLILMVNVGKYTIHEVSGFGWKAAHLLKHVSNVRPGVSGKSG